MLKNEQMACTPLPRATKTTLPRPLVPTQGQAPRVAVHGDRLSPRGLNRSPCTATRGAWPCVGTRGRGSVVFVARGSGVHAICSFFNKIGERAGQSVYLYI